MSCDNEMRVFCENVRKIRKEDGLTQKEMAQILGSSIRTLAMIEMGKVSNRVGVDVLVAIHRKFSILPSEMFCE